MACDGLSSWELRYGHSDLWATRQDHQDCLYAWRILLHFKQSCAELKCANKDENHKHKSGHVTLFMAQDDHFYNKVSFNSAILHSFKTQCFLSSKMMVVCGKQIIWTSLYSAWAIIIRILDVEWQGKQGSKKGGIGTISRFKTRITSQRVGRVGGRLHRNNFFKLKFCSLSLKVPAASLLTQSLRTGLKHV